MTGHSIPRARARNKNVRQQSCVEPCAHPSSIEGNTMLRTTRNLRAKARREQGASAVEYGLLVALIAAVIVVAVLLVGGIVKGAFQDTKTRTCDSAEESSASTECTND